MSEAVTRSGSMRYHGSYLGKLVQDFLGKPASILLTAILFIDCCLLLLVYYLGISLTLAEATPIPATVWAGLIFLLGVYFVRQKTLNATVTSALMVGAINLGLILFLSILALTHLRPEHLLYLHIPFVNGNPFEPAILGLIFGVVLSASSCLPWAWAPSSSAWLSSLWSKSGFLAESSIPWSSGGGKDRSSLLLVAKLLSAWP
jgi:amino acid permease